MTGLLLDIRYALRMWKKHPSFTLAGLATITLAIAANTAIFSLVRGVLLKPLNLPTPDRVVRIEERHQGRRLNLTGATFADVRERTHLFSAVAEYRIRSVGLDAAGVPEQLTAADVSADYFAVIGLAPATGRWFTTGDMVSHATPRVILSDGLWKRRFGAANVVGTLVVIDRVAMEVVGIAPPMFVPGDPDIWLPQDDSSSLMKNRRAHLFTTIGRLVPSASLDAARQEMAALAHSIERDAGSVDPDIALVAERLQARLVESIRPALLMVWAAVGMVLLIGAANIANLLLMQNVSRARELSIRIALGAGHGRVIRQIVTECMLLASVGGLLGTFFGRWSIPVLRSVLPQSIPRAGELSTGSPEIGFGVAVSGLMAVLFALAPALGGAGRRPIDALRTRNAAGSHSLTRSLLVTAEVAITVILLSSSTLLGRSLWKILDIRPGYDPSQVVAFRLSLPPASYPDARAHNAFYSRVLERIAVLPNVSAAGVTGALPLTGTPATTMDPEGSRTADQLSADVVTASPGFFEALRIPLLRGRLFTPSDMKGVPVAIINETAARRFWPDGRSPLGRQITMKDWGSPYRAEVVGIIGDVHQAGSEVASSPAVYYPLAQFPETTLSHIIVVRANGSLESTISAVRNAVSTIDPHQPIAWARTMDDIVAGSVAERTFTLLLIGSFALAGLLLSALGVYGIVAFAVAERAQEFGVRMALGARGPDLLRVLFVHTARPIVAGMAAGLAGTLITSRLLETLLFGVRPTDPMSFIGVTVAIGLVAVSASAAPVRRAMRLDPIEAIRIE
jgi:putative ABC transport system permease protein